MTFNDKHVIDYRNSKAGYWTAKEYTQRMGSSPVSHKKN